MELDNTLWKDIPEYDGYEAHPLGFIRNKKTKYIYKSECKRHRYISIRINNIKTVMIHILIALTFCKNDNPDVKNQVNHKDGNGRNNKSDNLEWISPSNNVKDAVNRGRKNGKPGATPIRVIFENKTYKDYNSQKEAEEELELPNLTIARYISDYEGIYYGRRGIKNKKKYTPKYIFQNITTKTDNEIVEKNVDIQGFTHLIACSNGKLFDKKTRKEIRGSNDGRYLRIKSRNCNGISKSAHQLIALTFINNPGNKTYVNHKNGNTFDNSVSNLEWCTQSENMKHARETGLYSEESKEQGISKRRVPVYKLELDGTIIQEYPSVTDANISISEGADISSVCGSYSDKGKDNRYISSGYGWCYKKDYKEPIINEMYKKIFPELISRNDIDYNKIREFVSLGTRPVWQIDLDGTRIKLWNSPSYIHIEGYEHYVGNIIQAINDNSLCCSYYWQYATYEDIINPSRSYKKTTPEYIKNVLTIPDNKLLKPEVVALIRENITESGHLRIRSKPIIQLQNNNIIRYWSGPNKANTMLGYTRNTIERCLSGKQKVVKGYEWRVMTTDELCI